MERSYDIPDRTVPYSIPSEAELSYISMKTPIYMRPNRIPHAMVGEAILTDEQCDAIISVCMTEEPYEFHGCDAVTRELPMPLSDVMKPIIEFAQAINHIYWKFDLDKEPGAWFQSYDVGCSYLMHMDSDIGQTRKLTAVALLSPSTDYIGGELHICPTGSEYETYKTRGTVVIFPSWMPHLVTPVEEGLRQTLNVGFYGPPFR